MFNVAIIFISNSSFPITFSQDDPMSGNLTVRKSIEIISTFYKGFH